MPDEIRYEIFNLPMKARTLASTRIPPLALGVPEEFSELISHEIALGEWGGIDEATGEPINSKGQDLKQKLEFCITGTPPRPHWLRQVIKGEDEEIEKVWLSGNITLQGQRLVQLEKFCGSKAAALVMWKEEAERYNAKAGIPVAGTKPDDDKSTGKERGDEGNLTTNPWSKNYRGDDQAREKQIASILKMNGTKLAEKLAKAAGTGVLRPQRK
jgi:hypothetical protein